MPIPHVVPARPLGDHRVWMRFDDGTQGELNLAGELDGPILAPLRDPAYFARFSVDDTLVWPNGADFAPEFLRERLLRTTADESPAGR